MVTADHLSAEFEGLGNRLARAKTDRKGPTE